MSQQNSNECGCEKAACGPVAMAAAAPAVGPCPCGEDCDCEGGCGCEGGCACGKKE